MAEQENEQRRRLELAAAEALNNGNSVDVAKRNKINQKKQQVIYCQIKHELEDSNNLHVENKVQWDEIHRMIRARAGSLSSRVRV